MREKTLTLHPLPVRERDGVRVRTKKELRECVLFIAIATVC